MPERTITWAKSFFSHRDRERTRRIEALKLRNRVEPWAESPFKESMLSTFVQIRCWCHLLRLLGYSASLTSTCYDLDDHVRNFPILHRDSRTCSLKISRFADKWLSTRKQFYIYSGHECGLTKMMIELLGIWCVRLWRNHWWQQKTTTTTNFAWCHPFVAAILHWEFDEMLNLWSGRTGS